MDKVDVLQRSRLFENILPQELELLATLSVTRTYAAGDVVCLQGDVGDSVFIIAEGQVEVFVRAQGGEKSVAVLSAPEFLGEMSLIDKEHRAATVRAKVPTTLLVLSTDNIHTFSRTYREGFTWMVVNIARTLSARMRDMNSKLAARM